MSKKLLLADDSITIQKVIGITFAHEDYSLTVLDNGEAALNQARADHPDLILADVFMPGMNGYDLCAAVKQDPRLRHIPVLLLTGTFEPFDEAKANAAGADSWISKPFESQSLINRVEELLARAAAVPAAPPEAAQPVADPAEASIQEADLWADLADTESLADVETADLAAAGEGDGLWKEPAGPEDALWGDLPGSEEKPVEEPAADDWSELAAEVDHEISADEPVSEEEDSPSTVREEVAFEFRPEAPAPPSAEPENWKGPVAAEGSLSEWEGFEEDILPLDESDIIEEEELEEIAAPAGFPSADDLQVPADEFLFEVEETSAGSEALLIEGDAGEGDEFLFEDEVPAAEFSFEKEEAPADSGFVAPGGPDFTTGEFLFEEEAFAFEGELPPVGESEWELPGEETALEAADLREDAQDEATEFFFDDQPEGQTEISSARNAPDADRALPSTAAGMEERIGQLSEEEVALIVERTVGPVIERLAQAMLEKVAWEVVPDLAESMIRDEIRKIRESAAR